MAPARCVRTLFAAATTMGAVVAGLAAAPTVTAATRTQAPFPALLPVTCDKTPRVRKEAGSFTPAEWATYQRAVIGLHQRETSSDRSTLDWFERFIQLHNDYARVAHNGAHFLAWHRLFLLAYENALRSVEPTVTIPYWDWSMDSKAPEMAPVWAARHLGGAKVNGSIVGGAFDKFFVDTGSDGPHTITRGLQSGVRGSMRKLPMSLADKATMTALWSNKAMTFDRFSTALEAEHGMVHVAIGGFSGDMMDLSRAAGDVVFWSHHAYIDYVWWRRQQAIPSEKYVGKQGGKDVSPADVLKPFLKRASCAAKLSCVKYVADPRETRPPSTATSESSAAAARRSAAWLPCASDADCGCGSCVKNACVVGTASRTTAQCGAVAKCIRHPNPTLRQLVCRCLDRTKCQCTRSADCGCGVCHRSDGTCHAPQVLRRQSYCGLLANCVKPPRGKAFRCVPFFRCFRHRDCGCGACYFGRCLTRQWITRRRCGEHRSCIAVGGRLRCVARQRPSVKAAARAAGAAPAAVDAVADAQEHKHRALALFRERFSATVATETAVLAEAKEEEKLSLAEADADLDAFEEEVAAAAQNQSGVASTGRFPAAAARGVRLGAAVRAASASRRFAQMQATARQRARRARQQARHKRWKASAESHERVRVVALSGFTAVNSLDEKRFLHGEAMMKKLKDEVDVTAEKKAGDGAEVDEDAEVEDGPAAE